MRSFLKPPKEERNGFKDKERQYTKPPCMNGKRSIGHKKI